MRLLIKTEYVDVVAEIDRFWTNKTYAALITKDGKKYSLTASEKVISDALESLCCKGFAIIYVESIECEGSVY